MEIDFEEITPVFVIKLLIPTMVLMSFVTLLLLVAIPVLCCMVQIDSKLKLSLTIAFGVVGFILWMVSLKGISGGFFKELLQLIQELFDIANIVKDNIEQIGTCLDNSTFFDVTPITDIEEEIIKHKETAKNWYMIVKAVLITCYSFLGTACITFPIFVYKRWRISKIILCVFFSVILFIIFITMVPVSNGGYSALGYVCGSDMDSHNGKINDMILSFDDSVTSSSTFCDHEMWQYLCNIQQCNDGDKLIDDLFNVTELEQVNSTGTCDSQTVIDLIESTLDDTLGCTNVQSLYNKAIDIVICTEFYNLFVYTLWPVGLGTIFTVLLFTIGFLNETDYTSVWIDEF